jgi:hypothetical protein
MAKTTIWHSGGLYIVATAKRAGIQYGRAVNLAAGSVGPEEPTDTIARMSGGGDWEEFRGNPGPILKLLARHRQGPPSS